ncbi:MAG: PQQ-binding-like beta-propeller repeat protein [Acidobacteria bacterium]|nr:PQQ-binding-like beta-propeller repeat protein [Acidobacteriota bacterium]MDA1234527.1 PQQ-binding-like beta-propeller repeat protein [Acidobacteriota bacterium]
MMFATGLKVMLAFSVAVGCASAQGTASDWARFRGPDGAGSMEDSAAPIEMSSEAGFVWKRTIPTGKSSPVLAGKRVFLTARDGERLLTIALDRDTGETVWTGEIIRTHVDRRNELNDGAAGSPATDGNSVYVFFPDFGLAAYSVEGQELWRRRLGPYDSARGISTSPLLVEGVIVLMIEQFVDSKVLGVDAATGKTLWSVPRPTSMGGSYATPVAYKAESGEMLAVVTHPFELVAYKPKTGEKVWSVGGLPHQPKSSPMVVGDTIIVGVQGDSSRGNLRTWERMLASADKNGDGAIKGEEVSITLADYDHDGDFDQQDYEQWVKEKSPASRLMAVRPRGSGDLTDQAVLWRVDRGVPRITTPLPYKGSLFLMRNGGILSALDLETGAVQKEGRLRNAIDEYFASPVGTNGRVLTLSRACGLTWIKAAPEWEILSSSELGDECFATPALGHDGVFVRTSTAIYRFADQAQQSDSGTN